MKPETCQREDELLDALGRGFVAAELEAHAAECPACGDLRTVAGALLDDRAEAIPAAPVPSAGTMWWRIQVRRRQEAAARARRSLLVGQAASLVVALGLLVFFFGADLVTGLRHLTATLRLNTPVLLALAAWLLAAPVAGWVALRQK